MFRFYFMIISGAVFMLFPILRAGYMAKHRERYTQEQCYRAALKVLRIVRRFCFTKTDCFGEENLPESGGYIMYCNHQGKYDAVGVFLSHKKPATVLMEKKKMQMFPAKQIVGVIGGKPLDFDDMRQQRRVLDEISEEVRNGRRYLIFPEGGYADNKNELKDFHAGCFKCAVDSGCPVVPVAIYDSYKALNQNSLKPCRTQVHFLEPIMPEAYKEMNRKQLCALVKSRISEKLAEIDSKN